jgi:hypothetical protein
MDEIDSEPVQSGLEVRSVVARPVPLGRRHDRVDASDGLMVVVDLATNSAIAAGEMKRRQPMTTLAGGPHREGGAVQPYACANAQTREPRRTACPSAGTNCSRPQLTERKSPRSDRGMSAVSCGSVGVANCQVPCCTGRTKVISPLESVT